MHRIKRSLFVLLALILLPLSPARAEPADEILWRGTIAHVIDHSEHSNPQGSNLYPGEWTQSWQYRREIHALGDGTAIQVTGYYEYLQVSFWFHVNEPNECWGTYYATYEGTSTVTLPFDVYVDAGQIAPVYVQLPISVTRESNWDTCWEVGDFFAPQAVVELIEYTRPWFHQGAFSADDLVIAGRDRWPEANTEEDDGSGTRLRNTKFTTYTLSREESDWFSQSTKDSMNKVAFDWGIIATSTFVAGAGLCLTVVGCVLGGPIAIAGGVAGTLATGLAVLALDPPDPNFTEIAVPITPITSQQPILADGNLTQVQADALNALIENDEQGIGLARAILTSINRASGARVANDSYWVEQQLQASRTYAGQLAEVLDARPQLLADLKQALQTFPGLPFDITGEDMAKYKYDLVTNGFSAEQEQLLTELGLDANAQAQVLNTALLTEYPRTALPQDPIARFPDLLTYPELIQSTHELAIALREFAEGEGWKMYAPLVNR